MTTRTKHPRQPTVFRTECGTRGGYNRHSKRHEIPCQPCLDANRAYRRAWRADNILPAHERTSPTDTGACGTPKGYMRHHRAGEHACPRCKAAQADERWQHYHRGGGAEVQRRRRGTATALRRDREADARKRHGAKIPVARSMPSGFWRLASILRRLLGL